APGRGFGGRGGADGGAPPPGMGGGPPPGMGAGRFGRGGGDDGPGGFFGGQQEPPPANDGNLTIQQFNKTVLAPLELSLKDKSYQMIMDGAATYLIALRGEADASTTRSRIHQLAAATQEYVKAKGHFPRGAFRQPSSERVIDWAPAQRLSWMVDLLPFLPGGEYRDLFE